MFIIIGMIAGGIGGFAILETGVLGSGSQNGKALIFIVALGGFLGQWIHKQIGKSMRNPGASPKTPTPPQNTASPLANPPNAATTAYDKGVGLAVVVGIVAFIILCFVCTTTVGGGFFGPPETSINWPGIFIGTGVCAFIAYHVGKKS